jgi:hypothetical protein
MGYGNWFLPGPRGVQAHLVEDHENAQASVLEENFWMALASSAIARTFLPSLASLANY